MLGCSDRTVGTVALGDHQPASTESTADQPPVAINPVTPMVYPPALLEQGIEGRVLLGSSWTRRGRWSPTPPASPSRAAIPRWTPPRSTGAPELRFSPALRNGRPVAAPFLQPVHFRHPRSQGDP